MGASISSILADACLIVAAIASAKANEKVGIDWDAKLVEIDLGQRAEMFGSESLIWLKEGKQGKGYWCDFLGSDEPD